MDHWSRFAHTGDVREYLAYKAEQCGTGRVVKKHEQSDLHSDRNDTVCRAGRGI